MYFLGCDGGSSKYSYAGCNEHGRVLFHRIFPGTNIVEKGYEGFSAAIHAQMDTLSKETGIPPGQWTHCAFCLSGHGESRTAVRDMTGAVQKALGHDRFTLANDSVAAWSGALRLKPGIVVASGTGSVAYGEDGKGGMARAGGWSILYGDEGSSYWVSIRALNLFFRQADGRLPRTMLYDWFLKRFGSEDPQHLPADFRAGMRSDVATIAAFQREVLALCEAGDPQVRRLYADAGRELAALAAGIVRRLSFGPDSVAVSYTGGLFAVGDCVALPFSQEVEKLGAHIVPPAYDPTTGAVCYAARPFLSPGGLDAMFDAAGPILQGKG